MSKPDAADRIERLWFWTWTEPTCGRPTMTSSGGGVDRGWTPERGIPPAAGSPNRTTPLPGHLRATKSSARMYSPRGQQSPRGGAPSPRSRGPATKKEVAGDLRSQRQRQHGALRPPPPRIRRGKFHRPAVPCSPWHVRKQMRGHWRQGWRAQKGVRAHCTRAAAMVQSWYRGRGMRKRLSQGATA